MIKTHPIWSELSSEKKETMRKPPFVHGGIRVRENNWNLDICKWKQLMINGLTHFQLKVVVERSTATARERGTSMPSSLSESTSKVEHGGRQTSEQSLCRFSPLRHMMSVHAAEYDQFSNWATREVGKFLQVPLLSLSQLQLPQNIIRSCRGFLSNPTFSFSFLRKSANFLNWLILCFAVFVFVYNWGCSQLIDIMIHKIS